MNHWIVAPILLPLLAGLAIVLSERLGLRFQRKISLLATAALLALALGLLWLAADGRYGVYTLGDWPPPFGIVLVLDRLSGLMLVLTAVVALASLSYALWYADRAGRHFHALFQLQLAGLNGAFLTGDLFNLFVFFEILLIASFGLLLHGGGAARSRAALHYVILNLSGSALFLIAVGVLYGLTGTLNMADLAARIAAAPPQDAPLLGAAALLLLGVFGLKAALLPLHFWLPSAYTAAGAPVAALFAIMTKVGVYAILRVFTLVFGAGAGGVAGVAQPWLLPAALATLVVGSIGALASRGLRELAAYLTLASVGTLLIAVGLFSEDGLSAALFYLIHSTVTTAALFLVADLIGRQRGVTGERLQRAPPVAQPLLLGVFFFAGAVASAGLPPLSGFVGKLMILEAAQGTPPMVWVWSIVLATGALGLVALSRAGSDVFWNTEGAVCARPSPPLALAPAGVLLLLNPLLLMFAAPVLGFVEAAARQLLEPAAYIHSVLGGVPAQMPGD